MPKGAQRAIGCSECRETGFRGRAGVYEIMRVSDSLKQCIRADTDLALLKQQACREGMRSLRLAGAQKVASGLTTLEEVLRTTPANDFTPTAQANQHDRPGKNSH